MPQKWSGDLWKELKPPMVWVVVIAAMIAALISLAPYGFLHVHGNSLSAQQSDTDEIKELMAEIHYRATQIQMHMKDIKKRKGIGNLLRTDIDYLQTGIDPFTKKNFLINIPEEHKGRDLLFLTSKLKEKLKKQPILSEQERVFQAKIKHSLKPFEGFSTRRSATKSFWN